MRIPTPIPRSIGRWLASFVSVLFSAPRLFLWRSLLVFGGGYLILVLMSGATPWAISVLVGLIVSTVLSDNVRRFVSDLWNLRWFSVKI
jgi:hypothetical protein